MKPKRQPTIPPQLTGFVYYSDPSTVRVLTKNIRTRRAGLNRLMEKCLPPKTDLGALEDIPLELLQMFLAHLDLRTLTDFRRVSRGAMQVVDNIFSYRAIVRYAPLALCGILSVEVGQWITCEALYDELCRAECRGCGDFADFLYILGTCERVCYICFTELERYCPLVLRVACRRFGLDWKAVKALPTLKNIPGSYAFTDCSRHYTLVDLESARSAGVKCHGSITAMEQSVSRMATIKCYASIAITEHLMAVKKQQEYTESARTVALPRPPRRIEDPSDNLASNPMRYMAIVQAPCLDRTTQTLKFGFYCIGCEYYYKKRPMHMLRKFTAESFDEHLRQCGYIRNGVHSRASLFEPSSRF